MPTWAEVKAFVNNRLGSEASFLAVESKV
jgi:hypothetical protein